MSEIKLIVGLGNPGDQYKKTRHNVGFMIIDFLCEKFNLSGYQKFFNGEVAVLKDHDNNKIIFCKPLTFMNLSGIFIHDVIHFYKISLNNVFVIYDDIDLISGKIRIKKNGSSGGHNGMKNIIEQLKTQDIKRMKIGIGPKKGDLSNFVLSNFSNEDLTKIDSLKEQIFLAIKMFIENKKIDQIINLIN